MKIKIKQLVLFLLGPVILAGCAGRENEPDVNARKQSPEFTAAIGDTPTRAFDRQWESGDEIGISGASGTNVCHLTKEGDGRFTVKTLGEEIYFQDDEEVVFTAYYPWNSLGEEAAVEADLRMQARQKSFDFLWAQSAGKKASPRVKFSFTHRMAKVALTVRPGDGVSYEELKAAVLSLEGFRHKGSFNISDGKIAVENVKTDAWEFAGNENIDCNAPAIYEDEKGTVTYPLILFPQDLDAPLPFFAELPGGLILKTKLDFTAANSEKDGPQARNEWIAGRQYNLTVTLHKTGISLDRCTIAPWSEVNGGNINAEQ